MTEEKLSSSPRFSTSLVQNWCCSYCWGHCCNSLICESGRGDNRRAKRAVLELSSFHFINSLPSPACSLLEQMFWWGWEGLLHCSEDIPLCSPSEKRMREKNKILGSLSCCWQLPLWQKQLSMVIPSSPVSSHLCGCELMWLPFTCQCWSYHVLCVHHVWWPGYEYLVLPSCHLQNTCSDAAVDIGSLKLHPLKYWVKWFSGTVDIIWEVA